jgi:hypothetical protein
MAPGHGKGFRLPSDPIQSMHDEANRSLPGRIRSHLCLEILDRHRIFAEKDQRFGPILYRLGAGEVQPSNLVLSELLVLDILQRPPLPQAQRLVEEIERTRRLRFENEVGLVS